MYGSHALLKTRHYVSKPVRFEGSTNTLNRSSSSNNKTSKSSSPPNNNMNDKSKCNPTKTTSCKPPAISTHSPSNSISQESSRLKMSSSISSISTKSAKSPTKSKSHKHHKKKHKKSNHNKHAHAPILIFPYSWNVKDDKYENNKQFHKKCKPIPPRITLQHGIDHLLSPSKCSKRYLSAYCLNLHQLTSCEKLLESIIKKCTPVIKQLHHLTNEVNTKRNISPTDISPTISTTEFDASYLSKYSLNDNESLSMPPSPYQSPAPTAIIPITPISPTLNAIHLNVINDENDEVKQIDVDDDNKQIAYCQPTHHHPSIPVSNLDLVETRSCPDLDNEYNNMSDDIDQTTPPSHNTSILLTSKSTPDLHTLINNECKHHDDTQKQEAIIKEASNASSKHRDNIVKQDNDNNTTTNNYKTKMKAYCIATVKHNIDIIYHWIYYYPEDFAESKLLDRLLTYIAKVKDKTPQQTSIQRRWQKLLQLIQHRKPEMKHQSILSSSISNLRIIPKVREHGRKTSFQFTDSFFPPREMVNKLGGGIDLLKIHPALVADQLTLIDTEIFLQIRPREFTNQSWQNRPNLSSTELLNDDDDHQKNFSLYDKLNRQKIDAPNLLYMIDHVNRLSLWVATEILSRNTTAEMADLTKYFYVVAHRCLELCNIHTCTAIFGGICLQPLTRLRRLNRYLSDDQQIQTLHRALSEMVSSNHNYKTYRNFIEQWFNQKNDLKRPCIPFIPVVMKDLFQIQLHLVQRVKINNNNNNNEENNIDGIKHIDLGLLEKNCRHIRRVYETQQKAKLYANQLPADTDIQSKLRMNIAKFETHETLRAWSFEIQPKLTKEDKENLEMIDTLEEFGFL